MWTIIETCGYAKDCTLRELDVKAATEAQRTKTYDSYRSSYVGLKIDEEGFYYCGYCQRIGRDQLVKCPDCGLFFKGPKPWFSIDFECEKCG